jgi:protein-disulfide isomerase
MQTGKNKKIGSDFRSYMYENQASVTPENLRETVTKFAAAHKVTLPNDVDPKSKLAAYVDAEIACGKSLNVVHTPTIYVVSNQQQGDPFIEVVDRSKLFEQIEAMTPARATAKRAAASK